jgi:hypothetical protein
LVWVLARLLQFSLVDMLHVTIPTSSTYPRALVFGSELQACAGAGSADLQWSWESQGRLRLETSFGDYA